VRARRPGDRVKLRTVNAAVNEIPGDEGGLTVPGQPEQSWRVTAPEIARLRRHVKDAARRAGLDADRIDRYTFAVNEIVINAIQHGGGTAEVAIATGPGSVTVTVVDRGPGWNSDIPHDLPPPDRTHGRGLWLATRMCDDLTISSSATGTKITLRVVADANTN
jgi:anti-sigma regulatory factor (Ser/Thr protein kinase)